MSKDKNKPEIEALPDTQPEPTLPKDAPKDVPSGWARRKGQMRTMRLLDGTRAEMPTPAHMAASQLHGWDDHRHHTGGDMQITEAAYDAAIAAAAAPVPQSSGRALYVPHEPACSEHAAFKRCTPTVRRDFKLVQGG